MTQVFKAECFLCGVKGRIRAIERPVLDNCPSCDGLLSVHFSTEQEVLNAQNVIEEGLCTSSLQ